MRSFLGLSSDLQFKRYPLKVSDDVTEKVAEFFNKVGLKKGRTVFLVTDGYCFSTLLQNHYDFWIKLTAVLKELDYDIVINSPKETIPGIRYMFIPVVATSAFIGLCGNVISIPAEFIEASCTLNSYDKIKAMFLFPNLNDFKSKIKTIEDELMNINEFRNYGDKSAEKRKEGYTKFLKNLFMSNIEVSINLLGSNEQEDDELILKIIDTLEN